MKQMPNIICLGGGNAMPKAVLQGLKKYPVNLSVISAMLDSGGFAGRERESYQTVSFGDIRRAFLALSESTPEVKDAFSIRFRDGEHKGIVIANIFSTAIVHDNQDNQDYEKVFRVLRRVLEVPEKHQILPATLDNVDLCAELANGEFLRGETKIDISENKTRPRIKRVFLEPSAKAYPQSLAAIKNADLIVLGPGDLYSSLSQILLVRGIPEAIRKSRAKVVYVCNAMTKAGETDNFSVLDLTNEIEKYLGGSLDYVIYNNTLPSRESIEQTKKENPRLVAMVKVDDNLPKEKFIGTNLLLPFGPVIHDPQKLAKILLKLCRQ